MSVPATNASAIGAAATSARDRSFRRKLIYLAIIVALLMPLFWLSQPATQATADGKGQPGGVLARLREKYKLSQTELGQIDPTSETIRLATLGMRGVASTTLWWKGMQFQMKKDWTRLRATLDQISKLQPHSIAIWRYQAWNLSYNVSVSFDDYHDKYYWVIEGLKFMLTGVRANEYEPRLYWDVGWFAGNKIGKADEAKLYRRLFRKDEDFQAVCMPSDGAPPNNIDTTDNWHVGKAWFRASEARINPPRHPVRGMAEVIYYSDAPLWQIYYADNLEKDGTFDRKALIAWKQASREWKDFADMSIPSEDTHFRLSDKELLEKKAQDDVAALDKLAPGMRDKIAKEKLKKLAPDELKAWETPAEKRTDPQHNLVRDITDKLEIKHDEVARRVTGADRQEAMRLAKEAMQCAFEAGDINRERMKVNFDFWRTRCDAEQTADGLAGRKAIYDADVAFSKGDLIHAGPLYEEGFKAWRKVLDRFPLLVDDPNTGGDLWSDVLRYLRCLNQDEKQLPKAFILQDIVDKHGKK